MINKTNEWTTAELETLIGTTKDMTGSELSKLLPSKTLIEIFQKRKN